MSGPLGRQRPVPCLAWSKAASGSHRRLGLTRESPTFQLTSIPLSQAPGPLVEDRDPPPCFFRPGGRLETSRPTVRSAPCWWEAGWRRGVGLHRGLGLPRQG